MKTRLVALALVTAVLLTVGLTAAWEERRELRPGEAWLRVHEGAAVVVAHNGGPFFPVAGDQRVRPDDRVHVQRGTAVLEMRRDVKIELRRESDIVVDRVPRLRGGDVLVLTDSASAEVRGSRNSTVLVAPRSVARLSRTLSYGVAVYRGEATLRSAGSEQVVPRLRQASESAAGVVSNDALPILVDAGDQWDRRYLGVAIEMTRQLDAVSLGFTANVVTGPRPLADVIRAAIPSAVRTSDLEALVTPNRRPGELLVGTAIATAADSGFRPVFTFRDQGATWGLVALDQHLDDAGALFALLRLGLDEAPIVATTIAPSLAAPSGDRGRESGGDPGSPVDPGDPVDPRLPGDPDDPTPPAPSGGLVDDGTDTLEGVVEEVGEVGSVVTDAVPPVLEAVDSSTEPVVDDVTDTTDTLLSN